MTLAQGQQDKSQTAASLELEKENSRMCNIYTKAIFLMQELSKSVRTMPAISRARARERERNGISRDRVWEYNIKASHSK